jgi:hypothetical protein
VKSKWPSPKKCIDSSNNTEESGEATKEGEEVEDTGAGDEEVHLPYDTEECTSFFSPPICPYHYLFFQQGISCVAFDTCNNDSTDN